MNQWRLVFIISAICSTAGGIVYLFFGTSKEQPWNKYGKPSKVNEQEMQKLTGTTVIKSGEADEKIDTMPKDEVKDEQ